MKILVTGATDNVGRLVVDELLARGATEVRALTKDPARAQLPAEVEVFAGPQTTPAAFVGVERMYLAPHPPTVVKVCRMAAEAGVRHIVDMAGEKGGHWQVIEDAVEASGVPWTHLEPGEFMSNSGVWGDQLKAGDVVRDTLGDVVNAPIAIEDIAAVAAKILVEGGHHGQSYPMTGPEALRRREKLACIGAALGRDLIFEDLPREAAIEQLSLVMGEYATWYVDGLATLAEYPQAANTTVADLLGRPAMTMTEWARRHADMFQAAENAGR
jgi:uncharacterized protein YbjT (DUF2867 family)